MDDRNSNFHDPKKYWLDDPRHKKGLIWLLVILCVALFLADFAYHKHSHFGIENTFGFYALFSVVMGCVLVLGAKLLRVFVARDEKYYEKDE